MKDKPKNINVNISNGKQFFADEIAVMHSPVKFVFDFKNTTPRIDPRIVQITPMALEHNVIIMDLHTAKSFLKLFKESVDKYEKQFGKIKEPEALIKAMKQAQSLVVSTKEETPSYFG